jgi:hypothetical protein
MSPFSLSIHEKDKLRKVETYEVKGVDDGILGIWGRRRSLMGRVCRSACWSFLNLLKISYFVFESLDRGKFGDLFFSILF